MLLHQGALSRARKMCFAQGVMEDMVAEGLLIEQFLPEPQHRHSPDHTEHEVGEISFPEQFDVQQMADECSGIAAYDAHDEVHAASLALAAHDAVGNVTDEDACQYRPGREFCNVFKHIP